MQRGHRSAFSGAGYIDIAEYLWTCDLVTGEQQKCLTRSDPESVGKGSEGLAFSKGVSLGLISKHFSLNVFKRFFDKIS